MRRIVILRIKGLWIPNEVLLNTDLSDKEKMILSIVIYLSEDKNNCFASNKYIANILNISSDRVSKIINVLKNKEYIKVKLNYKLDSRKVENRQITPIKENIYGYSQKEVEGSDEHILFKLKRV